jgi:adenosylmethionine-8-amino-7-oxononanoate aminotransferase
MSTLYKWGAGRDPDHPVITDAYNEYLVTEEGEKIIDAAAGAAVVNLGHSPDGVADVMAKQASHVGYTSTSYFTSPPVDALSEKVAGMTPGSLNAVFLSNSGSEAVESAIKLARDYHVARGETERETVIGRWQGYHGATLGALSASGNTGRRTTYKPFLKDWPKIGPAYPYRWGYDGSPEEQAEAAARELEMLIRREGPETIAAFIAEPVSGSSIPVAHPHPKYYQEIRRICDEYGVVFIADEVMVGFGRTGKPFACEHFDVVPDMMTLGKGMSAGFAPISATVIRDEIVETLEDEEHAFYHGHTFSANPVSTAVADVVVDRYTPDLLENARTRGAALVDALEPLRESPIVGEIRQLGLMVGVEFVADRETKEPFDPELKVYERVFDRAFDRGVYVYPGSGSVDGHRGDHVMLSPPLTLDAAVGDEIARVVLKSVADVEAELGY